MSFVTNQCNSVLSIFTVNWWFIFNDNNVKINKLNIYNEDCNSLENWLIQLDMYFVFKSLSEHKKTLYAVLFLQEKAQHWFRKMFQSYLNNQKDCHEVFSKYRNFKKQIWKIFKALNEEKTVERIIQHIHQKMSVSEYTVCFQKWLNLTDWNDIALMIMF